MPERPPLPIAGHVDGLWRYVLKHGSAGLRVTFSRMPEAGYYHRICAAPASAGHKWPVRQLAQIRAVVEQANVRAAATRDLCRARLAPAAE